MEIVDTGSWSGASKPFKASYGKLMMWFFLLSDALTFSGFLVSYGFARFKFDGSWPIPDEVFNHFPFMHGQDMPMLYVALMTFILIFSSVTMVLAVDAGHHLKKGKVSLYMFLTIIGGLIFVGSQAWEWKNFILGQYGALETRSGQIIQLVNADTKKQIALDDVVFAKQGNREQLESHKAFWFKEEPKINPYTLEDVISAVKINEDIRIREQITNEQGEKVILSRAETLKRIDQAEIIVKGANMVHNEYGNRLFANFFFFITGFHGFHVFSGVVINIIIYFNVILGTYEKRKHYEMVEKVGLYWHFVDLVWVFVFTFFYLV